MARTPDKHHVLPLFCDDLIASCVDMTPACFGGYVRLLCYAWARGGIPNDQAACSRIAGGLELCDWSAIRLRLILIDSGAPNERLSHARLELERAKVVELKAKKSKAGKRGNRKRWEKQGVNDASQSDRKTIAQGIANASQNDRKTIAPTPTPTPTPNKKKCSAHTPDGEACFSVQGEAEDAWEPFVRSWNATHRACPWTPLVPPAAWGDFATSDGWLGRAEQALERLPACEWFDTPVALTKFFEYVDRILAGEFDNPKHGRRARQPAGGNL
jgi:uncharacterized protein YdaU (DUF1376 family)